MRLDDGTQSKDIARGLRVTHGRRAPAKEGNIWGDVRGLGLLQGTEWGWMKNFEEGLKAFGIKFEGWREATQKVGRWFRRVEEGTEVFMRR